MPRTYAWRFRPIDRWPFRLVCFVQLLPAVLFGLLAWLTGFAVVPVGVLILYVLFTYFGISHRVQQDVAESSRVRRNSRLYQWAWLGFVFQLLLVGLVAWYAVAAARGAAGQALAIALMLWLGSVTILVWVSEYRAIQGPHVPWLLLGTTMVGLPLVLAWLPMSTTWGEWVDSIRLAPGAARGRLEHDRVERIRIATSRAHPECDDAVLWLPQVGGGLRVAVALSGGGYRAAITQAGFLAALDHHCVPIRYLTTVSGGSIIGTYYALGYPPAAFLRRLLDGPPGLPNDLLVTSARLRLGASDADLYAEHFARVFFGQARLEDLPRVEPVPLTLLVNATDLEAGAGAHREVFVPGQAADLDRDTRLADIVAASGAFPGAFGPKSIRWSPPMTADRASTAKRVVRKFVDGGPVENLGVEGLRHYLAVPDATGARPPKPHLLIIADASKATEAKTYPQQVAVIDLFTRSYDISYTSLHEHLYLRYTGHPQLWNWVRATKIPEQVSRVPYATIDPSLATSEPSDLMTVVVPLTAGEIQPHLTAVSGCRFEQPSVSWWSVWDSDWWHAHGHGSVQLTLAETHREVAAFDTLAELSRREAAEGFWTGYAVGALYWSAIKCAARRAIDLKAKCISSPPSPAELCPPVSKLLTIEANRTAG